jgi:ABC-type transport system involved in cytochrome bd biosynthesis fused ATPase/permease subunit
LTQDDEKIIVSGVNLSLRSKDLLVVVGKVGSGKTTFLHSIMGETKLVKGSVSVKGTIAYVEQEPFILSSSVKDNILLGKKLNEALLSKAL